MAKLPSLRMRVWRHHVLVGVPLAAFIHSVLQIGYDSPTYRYSSRTLPSACSWEPVILVPLFSLQALLFVPLMRRLQLSLPATAACWGILQVLLVGLWNLRVGIQPNFSGRFPFGRTDDRGRRNRRSCRCS